MPGTEHERPEAAVDPTDPDPTAELAARRRGRKRGVRPAAPPAPAPVEYADAAVETDDGPPTAIKVSRSALADYLLRTDGRREFGRPAGVYEPVLGPGQAVPIRGDYVRAEFDCYEELIPLRAYTPVSRLLFRRGWLVRRDVYEEVARQQREDTSATAELPSAVEVRPPLTEETADADEAVAAESVGAPAQT